jgi:tRNA (cytidine32/uridine32-2'-O)-methyltransferase
MNIISHIFHKIMLQNLRIVLVQTSHPGNIGSAARAMKTMGIEQLYLVSPEKFPHPKANELATSAVDILERAIVVNSLEEAIADCTLVVGTSARMRKIPWPLITPREMAVQLRKESAAGEGKMAILFGQEQSGLTNEALQRCHLHVQIPTNPACSSLNLAAAVQLIAYELHLASLDSSTTQEIWDYPLASVEEMEKFFTHLQEVLIDIDFLKMSAPRKLMTRMRRLFARARPDQMEVNMLRGMLAAVQETIKKCQTS